MDKEKTSFLSRFNLKTDKVIPIVVIVLTGLSILMVYSMRGNVVLQHLKHLLFAFGGMFVLYNIDYKSLGRLSPIFLIVGIVLLVLTMFSQAIRGVSILGHDVQTFYLIGFLFIFYITNFIARKYKREGSLSRKSVLSMYFLLLIFCGSIATLNMSTAIILFATGIVIFFVGGVKLGDVVKMVVVVLVALVAVVVVVANMSDDKKAKIGRMATFINRWEYYFTNDNENGYGDQMILARAAIARSGFSPAGPGNGVIKNRLPEKETDYAFASMFEEMGIFVGLVIIFSYLIILYRARKIAYEAEGIFGRLLAFGIGFWFTLQAFVHIGVNCELLPTTGQTLPFISSGGSSLMVSGCAIGVLLNIAKVSQIEKDKENPLEYFQR